MKRAELARLAQIVAKDTGISDVETAHREGIEARIKAVATNARAGCIGNGVEQGLRITIFKLLLGDGRNRLWGLHKRGVDLGAGCTAARHITVCINHTTAAAINDDLVEYDCATLCLRRGGLVLRHCRSGKGNQEVPARIVRRRGVQSERIWNIPNMSITIMTVILMYLYWQEIT